MATKKAASAGAETPVLEFDAIANQLISQAEAIQKIAEGQALSDKQPDSDKDVVPATDPASAAIRTADQLKTLYAADMRLYTGLKFRVKDSIGGDVRSAMAEARRHLTKAYLAYRAAVLLTREAMTNRAAQAAQWAESNESKIVTAIEKEEEALQKKQAKIATLRAQQAAAQRGRRATA